MASIPRTKLFGKLNEFSYKTVESATVFCKMRGNPYVELVHWINQILQSGESDLHCIARHYDVDESKLSRDITANLDQLPRGATSISDFSPHIEHAIKEGYLYSGLLFDSLAVRTLHVLTGIKKSGELSNVLHSISGEFTKIKIEDLLDNWQSITESSPENSSTTAEGTTTAQPGEASGSIAPAAMGKQEALQKFTVDLTAKAKNGEIDPIVGRDEEIRKIVDILMRRRQNNPILTGEAGVGKTAVVEGFAIRLANDDLPSCLKGVRLLSLDMGLLQAGASMKGEFENRLKQVIEEIQSSPTPIILFIDEAHTLIGAGGAAGQNDAANLLKPALARGTLRTIAATTWAEYKKYFEKDPALTRRFQNILVDEPGDDNAVRMMRSMASVLEKHHQVQVLDEALEAAVVFSRRYIPSRQLPDKAVSVLDTACARVAIGQSSEPAAVEDCRRKIEALKIEQEIIERETAVGVDHVERGAEVAELMAAEKERLEELTNRWTSEKELVNAILALRKELRQTTGIVEGTGTGLEEVSLEDAEESDAPQEAKEGLSEEECKEKLAELHRLQDELAEKQGEHPLILPAVGEQAVAEIIGEWTGIPIGRMVKDEVATVLNLTDVMKTRVIGQDHGLDAISKRIQTARASLADPEKPIAVIMLAGPSGVGKTETALALAETLYGGEQNLVTINMSEFQEAHTVSTLKGAPPGYVGYGEGGVLTEAVRRKPYSVVLLDEVEKAHPDVHEIFFQVFDKGHMDDGEGRHIDFRNTVIILTTNVGSDMVMNLCKDPDLMPEPEAISSALRGPLLETFPAALLGRIVVVPYYPLSPEMMNVIIAIKLGKVKKRTAERYGAELTYDDKVEALIVERCSELESGARMIDAIITNTLLPRISTEFLTRTMNGEELSKVTISAEDGEFVYGFQ